MLRRAILKYEKENLSFKQTKCSMTQSSITSDRISLSVFSLTQLDYDWDLLSFFEHARCPRLFAARISLTRRQLMTYVNTGMLSMPDSMYFSASLSTYQSYSSNLIIIQRMLSANGPLASLRFSSMHSLRALQITPRYDSDAQSLMKYLLIYVCVTPCGSVEQRSCICCAYCMQHCRSQSSVGSSICVELIIFVITYFSTLMNIENVLITSREEIMSAVFYHNELNNTEDLTFVTDNGHRIHTQSSVLSK